jgi:hypothetical protein
MSGIEIIKPRNHAFGVDDVEVFIPAGVQINTFSNDRQQSFPFRAVFCPVFERREGVSPLANLAGIRTRFSYHSFADSGNGRYVYHFDDGMQRGIAAPIAYCFVGEVFISGNFGKIRDIRCDALGCGPEHPRFY